MNLKVTQTLLKKVIKIIPLIIEIIEIVSIMSKSMMSIRIIKNCKDRFYKISSQSKTRKLLTIIYKFKLRAEILIKD